MKIIDNSNSFDSEHKTFLKETIANRLKAVGLERRISTIEVVNGEPASEFKDKGKSIITLHIGTKHLAKPNAKWMICHEIQHRIDELNLYFGFDKSKKHIYRTQYGDRFTVILAHLWDINIDGRLDKLGIYEINSSEKIGIKG